MKIVIATLAILAMLAGFYLWYTADQPLDPLVREWLRAPPDRVREQGNGYLYLAGILAGGSADPAATGLQLIGEADADGEGQVFFRAEFREEDLPLPPIKLPAGPLLCVKGESQCLHEILARADEIPALVTRNAELLARYHAFLDRTWYQTATGRSARRIDLPYGALTSANRLHHLEVIHALDEGDSAGAFSRLTGDIGALRRMLARADDLQLKLTLALALTEDYRLLADLYTRGRFADDRAKPAIGALAPLTEEERSVEEDMRRRFRAHAESVYNFRGRRERRGDVLDPFRWSLRMLHKPNRTLNEVFPRFYRNYRLSVVSASEYLAELRKPFDDHIRIERDNFVGSVLNRKAVPNFQGYIGVFHDLDCFIALVRVRLRLPPHDRLDEVDLGAEIARTGEVSPFDGSPPFLHAQAPRVCLASRRVDSPGGAICLDL